jgi:hypothetical protein
MLDVWWLLVKSHLEDGAWVTPPNRLFRESVDQPPTLKWQFLVKVQHILSISNFESIGLAFLIDH